MTRREWASERQVDGNESSTVSPQTALILLETPQVDGDILSTGSRTRAHEQHTENTPSHGTGQHQSLFDAESGDSEHGSFPSTSSERESLGANSTSAEGTTSLPTGALEPLADTQTRPRWPTCRAVARSTGKRCRAAGDGVHGLCKHHTGLTLRRAWQEPQPVWELRVGSGGIQLAPDRLARIRGKRQSWPQRVSWSIALRLVTSGQVTRALLAHGEGASLLRELEACGVKVTVDGSSSELVRRVAFEVPDIAAATNMAKRRWRAGRKLDGEPGERTP